VFGLGNDTVAQTDYCFCERGRVNGKDSGLRVLSNMKRKESEFC